MMKNVSREERERFYAEFRMLEIRNRLSELKSKQDSSLKEKEEGVNLNIENENLLKLFKKRGSFSADLQLLQKDFVIMIVLFLALGNSAIGRVQ